MIHSMMPQPPYLYPSMGKTLQTTSGMNTPTGTTTTHTLTLPLLSPNASILNADRDEMLCRYPSKLCDNQRSEKRGGGLHRFCAYHRERANVNQRRVDHRRRLRRQGMPVPPIDRTSRDYSSFYPPSDSDVKTEDDEDVALMEPTSATIESSSLLPEFSETELQLLLQLLEDVDDFTLSSPTSMNDKPVLL